MCFAAFLRPSMFVNNPITTFKMVDKTTENSVVLEWLRLLPQTDMLDFHVLHEPTYPIHIDIWVLWISPFVCHFEKCLWWNIIEIINGHCFTVTITSNSTACSTSFSGWQQRKHPICALLAPLSTGNPLVNSKFHSQSNWEIVSMAWRHHGNWYWTPLMLIAGAPFTNTG